MKRKVELYGRLREVAEGLEVDLAPGASAQAALEAVGKALGRPELLKGAVLASESEVLVGSAVVPAAGRLAVLPPVCGG